MRADGPPQRTGDHMGANGASGGRDGREIGRRDILRYGGLGVAASLTAGLAAAPAPFAPVPGRARACLLVWLGGGVSHLDNFDPKPDAPAEVRGAFGSIATAVPGLRLGEHLPRLAGLAGSFALVRSVGHDAAEHATASYRMMTGHAYPRAGCRAEAASREDDPHLGSVLAASRSGADSSSGCPPFIVVADRQHDRGPAPAGRQAGALGPASDPIVCTPGVPPGWAVGTLARSFGPEAGRAADRYGRGRFGRSVLLGRRLVEAGARFVQVDWPGDGGPGWDTHAGAFGTLREDLLPQADRALAALLSDLTASGRLAETLVVVASEFGRTPRVNALGGRDHWPHAFSVLLAGASISGGQVVGATDDRGAYPLDGPVPPGQLAATIAAALGVTSTAAPGWGARLDVTGHKSRPGGRSCVTA